MFFSDEKWQQIFSQSKDNCELLKLAESVLQHKLYTVTEKRHVLPEGGSPNDYVSIAPYWWPDPEKTDGLPWIRRDGEINPLYYEYDVETMFHCVNDIDLLLVAGFSLKNVQFLSRAAEQLRHWFIKPETRMNPHVKYGQFVPGICTGRCYGIVDFYAMSEMLDLVSKLPLGDYWSKENQAGLQFWMSSFVDWLLEDELGKTENAQSNNHGTYYDMIVVNMALYAGRKDVALRQLKECSIARLEYQFDSEGGMPAELERTNSKLYSCEGLSNFMYLAMQAKNMNMDFPLEKIRQGFLWLHKHVFREDWGYQQISPFDQRYMGPIYGMACELFETNEYDGDCRRVIRYPWERLFLFPRTN